MSANNSRLVVKNLQKSFKKRQVVKSFSLEIESGEVIGLLGPNGADILFHGHFAENRGFLRQIADAEAGALVNGQV